MKVVCSIPVIALIALFLVLSAGCTSNPKENYSAGGNTLLTDYSDSIMQTSLAVLQGESYTGIKELFSAAQYCAGYAGTSNLQEKMSGIISDNHNVLTVTYIGNDGILKAITPKTEGISVGDSLSYQDSVAMMNENKTPLLTDLFELKQGGYAAAVYYPVFSGDEYLGFISIAFSPENFFSNYARALKDDYGFEVMVLQTDGVILYDPDETETGQPTFDNPAYEDFPGIIEAAEKVVSDWSGSCEYSYYATGTEKEVTKKAFWTTVAGGGNEWRIMIIKNSGEE